MTLFDMSGKVASITGSSRGIDAPSPSDGRAWRQVVISSRKQQVCDEGGQRRSTTGPAKEVGLSVAANISTKDDLKHLVEETNRCSARSTRWSATPRRILITAAGRNLRRPVSARFWTITIVANHWLISLVCRR